MSDGKAKRWVEANFPDAEGLARAALIVAYGAGLDEGLAEAQQILLETITDGLS